MRDEDLAFLSIQELAHEMRARRLTSTMLTHIYLDRLERIGIDLGAAVTIVRERALAEAAAADRELADGVDRGPLHGIPYGVKDICAARGAPTTWGAGPFKDRVFDRDAAVVRRLRHAGAVLVAKLATVELAGAFGAADVNAITGVTKNPWDVRYSSGGSSNGSAVAVAAGLVGFSIGSETSGSLLVPAGSCGVSALRPTMGRVGRDGMMLASWTLDKIGSMGRSAMDCGLVLAAIARRGAKRARHQLRRLGDPRAIGPALRIGIPAELADMTPTARANFDAAVDTLQPFVRIVRGVELPLRRKTASRTVENILAVEASVLFRPLIRNRCIHEIGADAAARAEQASRVTAADYADALRERAQLASEYAGVWRHCDVLLSSNGSGAIRLDADRARLRQPTGRGPGLIPSGNLLGAPALAIANGFADEGVPTSMQLVGPPKSDMTLVAIGLLYQRLTDWHRRRPAALPSPAACAAASRPVNR